MALQGMGGHISGVVGSLVPGQGSCVGLMGRKNILFLRDLSHFVGLVPDRMCTLRVVFFLQCSDSMSYCFLCLLTRASSLLSLVSSHSRLGWYSP